MSPPVRVKVNAPGLGPASEAFGSEAASETFAASSSTIVIVALPGLPTLYETLLRSRRITVSSPSMSESLIAVTGMLTVARPAGIVIEPLRAG